MRFSRTPIEYTHAPPVLGQHTDEVLRELLSMEDAQIARLQEQVAFYTTARVDAAHQAVRFVTSWATTDAQVDALLAVLAQVLD